ncbi:ATP-binding protein [Azotosporobacter soli]|uniref:ATP-binding protein n=1 Tax=Azotosporobacter soli TaxID=3055040 RepID=UPI0031FEDCA9
MTERAQQIFCAKDETVYEIIDFVKESMRDVGLSERKTMQLELVTEELVVNVSHYAYPGSSGTIQVDIAKEPDHVELIFSDEGQPFDPTAAKPPDLEGALEERDIGGLGIYLVHQLVDKVEYRRAENRNILTLTINRPQ